jgi:hypothetical protein
MGKRISKPVGAHELEPVSLSELIHQHVRAAIETAVHEELRARSGRVLTSAVKSEGATATASGSGRSRAPPARWRSRCLAPRSSAAPARKNGRRRSSRAINGECRRVNEAVIATYLAGGNTRRIRSALQPLLKAAPLSRSAVSRVVATLKDGLEAWWPR